MLKYFSIKNTSSNLANVSSCLAGWKVYTCHYMTSSTLSIQNISLYKLNPHFCAITVNIHKTQSMESKMSAVARLYLNLGDFLLSW